MEAREIAAKLLEISRDIDLFLGGMERLGMDMDKTELAQLDLPAFVAEVMGIPLDMSVELAGDRTGKEPRINLHDIVWNMFEEVDYSEDSISRFLDQLQELAAKANDIVQAVG